MFCLAICSEEPVPTRRKHVVVTDHIEPALMHPAQMTPKQKIRNILGLYKKEHEIIELY